jgi:Cysteine-rich secretory protein family
MVAGSAAGIACSGAASTPMGWDDSGAGGGSGSSSGQSPSGGGSGSPADGSSGASSSGGTGSDASASSSSSGGSGSGSGSGSNGGSGSGSGSGSSGGSGSSSSGSGSGGRGSDAGAGDAASRADSSVASDAGAVDGGLSDAAEQQWLAPMNQARAAVGEAPFVWDPIAAQVALAYASQCNYAHNANRNSDYTTLGGKGGVGENIAAGAPTETVAAAVNSWLAEASSYDHTTNTCSSTSPGCGHYTQIVWKATTGVGCAHVSCTANSPFTGFATWDFSVCDYSPPGNVGTQSPY